jgi:hypothetical protein
MIRLEAGIARRFNRYPDLVAIALGQRATPASKLFSEPAGKGKEDTVWLRPGGAEPRWPALVAVLGIGGLYAALPPSLVVVDALAPRGDSPGCYCRR